MAFVIIGALGFVWMGFWVFLYKRPRESRWVNEAELAYIEQNEEEEKTPQASSPTEENLPKMSFLQCIRYKQAWAFAVGKFLTDGFWWFFLFWTPAYLSDVYHLPSNAPMAQLLIFVLYAITMLSIIGGWLPTYFVEKKGMNPYKGRMRAMLIFAFFPIITLLAQPLGGLFILVPDNYYRYSRSSPPGMVLQYLLYRERHVPAKRHRHYHRLRRHGGRHRLLAHQYRFGSPVRLCRQHPARLYGLYRKAGRIFHHLLHLLGGIPHRMDYHESTCS